MKQALCIAALIAFSGCQPPSATTTVSGEQVRQEAREAAETAIQYASQEKEKYLRQMQAQLDTLDQTIADWKQRLEKETAEARARLEPRLEELEKQRAEVAKRLEELKNDSRSAWQELKAGLDKAYLELRNGVDRAREQFK